MVNKQAAATRDLPPAAGTRTQPPPAHFEDDGDEVAVTRDNPEAARLQER
jgi:hypothetical protein